MPRSVLKLYRKASSVDRVKKRLSGTDMMIKHHNYGVGRTIAKKSWMQHSAAGDLTDCHWLVTRVSPGQIVRTFSSFSAIMSAWYSLGISSAFIQIFLLQDGRFPLFISLTSSFQESIINILLDAFIFRPRPVLGRSLRSETGGLHFGLLIWSFHLF